MVKSTQHTYGVQGIINRARTYNKDIGTYEEHYTNANFGFTVKLSNGRLEMSVEMAQDQEVMPTSVSEDRIRAVANTFKNNKPAAAAPQERVIEKPSQSSPKLSFWQRIRKVFGL